MKIRGRAFKSAVALLLALIMMVGTVLPVAAEGAVAISNIQSGTGGGTVPDSGEPDGGAADSAALPDWLEITYTNNSISIVLSPEFGKILGMSRSDIDAILDTLVEALKAVVIEQMRAGFVPEEGENPADDIWKSAVEDYVSQNLADGGEVTNEHYIDFFASMLCEEEHVRGLVEYTCDMVRQVVGAGVDVDKLPEPDALSDNIIEILDAYVKDELCEIAEEAIGKYARGELSDSELDTFAKAFVDDLFESLVEHYVDGTVGNEIDEFGKEYIDTLLLGVVDRYINGTLSSGGIDGYASDLLDDYFKRVIKSYIHGTPVDAMIDAYVNSFIDGVVHDTVNEFLQSKVTGNHPVHSGRVWEYAYSSVEEYVTDYITAVENNYVDYKDNGAEFTYGAEILAIVESFAADLYGALPSFLNKYVAYMDHDELPDDYDTHHQIYDFIDLEAYEYAKEKLLSEYGALDALLKPSFEEKYFGGDSDFSFDDYHEFRLNGNFHELKVEGYIVEDEILAKVHEIKYETLIPSVSIDDVLKELAKPENVHVVEDYIDNRMQEIEQFVISKLHELPEQELDLQMGEMITRVLSELDANGTDLKELFKTVLRDVSADSARMSALITAALTELYSDSVKYDELIGKIKNADNIDSLLGRALYELFDLGSTPLDGEDNIDAALREFSARVEYITDSLVAEYAITLAELKEGEKPEIEATDLLKYLKALSLYTKGDESVGGVIYDGDLLDLEALDAIVEALPTFEEIANMDAADMRLDYKVGISAELFGQILSAEFDLSLAISPDEKYAEEHDKIRLIAQFIHDTVKLEYDDETGLFTLDITMPEIISKAFARLLNSESLSPELKEKLYSVVIGDVDEMKRFYNELTFDELISLIEGLDFEGFVDELEEFAAQNSQFAKVYNTLKSKFDFTKYTTESIIAKLRPYENKYDSIKKKLDGIVNKLFSFMSENLTEGEGVLSQLYTGQVDGYAQFEFNSDYDFSLVTVLNKLDEAASQLLKKYPSILSKVTFILGKIKDSLGENDRLVGTLDMSVKIKDIHEITYVIADEVHRYGFLPKGVNPAFYAGATTYLADNGMAYAIDAWVNERGEEITAMPASATTLYAKVNLDSTVTLNLPTLSFTYDASARELMARVTSYDRGMFGNSPIITYKWYKDGVLLDGEAASKLLVKDLSDNGRYTCEVTLTNGVNSATASASSTVTVGVPRPATYLRDEYGSYYYSSSYINVNVGGTKTLTASAESNIYRDFTYQWYRRYNGRDYIIDGATSASYTLTDQSAAGNYFCKIGYLVSDSDTRYYVDTVAPTFRINKTNISTGAVWDLSNFVSSSPYVILGENKLHGVDYLVYNPAYTINGLSFNELFNVTVNQNGKMCNATISIKDTSRYVFSNGYTSIRLDWYRVPVLQPSLIDVQINGESKGNPQGGVTIDEIYMAYKAYELSVVANGNFESTSVSWTKGGFAYSGAPIISEVADSGVYTWTLKTNDYGYTQSISGTVTAKIGVSVALRLNGTVVPNATDGIDINEIYSPDKEYAFTLSLSGATAGTVVEWKKDGAVFNGTPTFKTVADSGSYEWTVRTTLYPGCEQVVSGVIDINIEKQKITLESPTWVGDREYTYSPENHNAVFAAPTLDLGAVGDALKVTYLVNGEEDTVISRPDTYIVTASLSLLDTQNYELVGETEYETELVVNKYTVSADEIVWKYDIRDGDSSYESGNLADKSLFNYREGRTVYFSLYVNGLSKYIEVEYTADSDLSTDGIVLAPQERAEGSITLSGFKLKGRQESFSDYYVIDGSFSNTATWTYVNTREVYIGHIFDGNVTVYDRGQDEILRGVSMSTIESAVGTHATLSGIDRLYLINKYELSLEGAGGNPFDENGTYDVRIYIDTLGDYAGDEYGDIVIVASENGAISVISEIRRGTEGEREYIEFRTINIASSYTVAVENPEILPNEEYYDQVNDVHIKDNTDGYVLNGYNLYVTKWLGATTITLPSGLKFNLVDAYNIRFLNEEGQTPTYGDDFSFKVTLRLPEGVDLEKLHILYVDQTNLQDGLHESYEYEISEGGTKISFNASHFSVYAIAVEAEIGGGDGPVIPGPDTPGPDTPTPDTPEEPISNTGILLAVFITMLLIAFGVLMLRTFSGKITKRELVILLLVLIFVIVMGTLALIKNLSPKQDAGDTSAYTYEINADRTEADVAKVWDTAGLHTENNNFREEI